MSNADAGVWENCEQNTDPRHRIRACTEIIDSGDGDKWNVAAAFFYRGNARDAIGKYEQAINDYDSSIELNPRNPNPQINKGGSLVALGRSQDAIEIYNRLLNSYKPHPLAYLGRGEAYFILRKFDNAIKDFEAAIRVEPNLYFAYDGLGTTYNFLEEYETALSYIDAGLSINPNSLRLLLRKRIVLHDSEQYKGAINEYTRVINSGKHLYISYFNRSISYTALGKYEKSISDISAAIKVIDIDALAYMYRANYLCSIGDVQSSLRDWRVVLDAGMLDIQTFLQQILSDAGFYKGSIDGYFGEESQVALGDWVEAGCPAETQWVLEFTPLRIVRPISD